MCRGEEEAIARGQEERAEEDKSGIDEELPIKLDGLHVGFYCYVVRYDTCHKDKGYWAKVSVHGPRGYLIPRG